MNKQKLEKTYHFIWAKGDPAQYRVLFWAVKIHTGKRVGYLGQGDPAQCRVLFWAVKIHTGKRESEAVTAG